MHCSESLSLHSYEDPYEAVHCYESLKVNGTLMKAFTKLCAVMKSSNCRLMKVFTTVYHVMKVIGNTKHKMICCDVSGGEGEGMEGGGGTA